MRDLGRWTLQEIVNHDTPLPAIEKLVLSQELPLLEETWLRPSVGALILISLETYSGLSSELARLHPAVLTKINIARETLHRQREILAFTQLPSGIQPGAGCSHVRHESTCYPVWVGIWWNQVARRLLQPEENKRIERLTQLPAHLRSMRWDGITPTCVELFIQALEAADIFQVENRIFDAATCAIRELFLKAHNAGRSAEEFDFSAEEAADEERANAMDST